MSMRHKFYLPIGMPTLGSAPTDPLPGDTYYDSVLKKVRTWDGDKWTAGGGELTAGAGLVGGGSTAGDIVLSVGQGTGIKVDENTVSLDVAVTSGLYVKKSGDSMQGRLGLSRDPVDAMEAAHKGYVDARDAVITALNITAGNGLGGGGRLATQPTLSVNAGTGIVLVNDAVALNTAYTATLYAPKTHAHEYAALGHTHTAKQANVTGVVRAIGRIPPRDEQQGFRRVVVAHGHGSRPTAIAVTVTADDTQFSVSCSVESWDTTNVALVFYNMNATTGEDVSVSIIGIH